MARIVLHIGSEKTGTSYLQRLLYVNAPLLRKRYGLLYPTDDMLCQHNAHYPLAATFLPSERCDFIPSSPPRNTGALFEHLNQVIAHSGCEQVLLSAEHFSSRFDRAATTALAAQLSGHSVHILFYVRRQDEMALSALATDLCCGHRDWLPFDRISPDDRRFNPLQVIDDWRAAFGTDAITVRSYAEAAEHGIAADLLSHAGLNDVDIATLHQVDRINQRIGYYEARLLHGINQILPTWREAVSVGSPESYHQANLLRAKLLTWMRDEKALTQEVALEAALPPAERTMLMDRFARINEKLIQSFGLQASDFVTPTTEATPALADALPSETEHMLMAQALHVLGLRLLRTEKHHSHAWHSVRRMGMWPRNIIRQLI